MGCNRLLDADQMCFQAGRTVFNVQVAAADSNRIVALESPGKEQPHSPISSTTIPFGDSLQSRTVDK